MALKMKKMTMIGSTRFAESTRRSGRSGLSAPNEWFVHGRVPIDASVQRREAPVLAVGLTQCQALLSGKRWPNHA